MVALLLLVEVAGFEPTTFAPLIVRYAHGNANVIPNSILLVKPFSLILQVYQE